MPSLQDRGGAACVGEEGTVSWLPHPGHHVSAMSTCPLLPSRPRRRLVCTIACSRTYASRTCFLRARTTLQTRPVSEVTSRCGREGSSDDCKVCPFGNCLAARESRHMADHVMTTKPSSRLSGHKHPKLPPPVKDSEEGCCSIRFLKMKPMSFKANKFRLALANQLNCSNRARIEESFHTFPTNLGLKKVKSLRLDSVG